MINGYVVINTIIYIIRKNYIVNREIYKYCNNVQYIIFYSYNMGKYAFVYSLHVIFYINILFV